MEIEYKDHSILGVHIPVGSKRTDQIKTDSIVFWKAIYDHSISKMNNNKKVFIIGDMNTNLNVKTTSTDRMDSLKRICVYGRVVSENIL